MPNDKQIILGLDLDGVILDLTDVKIKAAQAAGFVLSPEDTPSEIIKHIIPEDIMGSIKHDIYSSPEHSTQTSLMEGSREGLQFLKENAVPYFLVSRRKTPEVAIQTLKRHNLWPRYFSEKNVHFVSRPQDKDGKAKILGLNCFLDDEESVLDCLSSVANRFLFDKYGVFKKTSSYPCVSSWQEFLAVLPPFGSS